MTKFKRLMILGIVLAILSLVGVGIGVTSNYLKTKTTRQETLANQKSSGNFIKDLSPKHVKIFLISGIILGVMAGFCFAAARNEKQ